MDRGEVWPSERLRLGALYHVFESLLNHLDTLDAAAQLDDEWNSKQVVKVGMDPAAKNFGEARSLVDMDSLSKLIEDLWERFESSLNSVWTRRSPLWVHLAGLQEVVNACPLRPNDLQHEMHQGEMLSRAWYRGPDGIQAVPERTIGASEIRERKAYKLWARPNKTGGESTVEFWLAADFRFEHFVNLPFAFFHEFGSHIHTAPMAAEAVEDEKSGQPFEDGWMLYAEYVFYLHIIRGGSLLPEISWPEYRERYAERYYFEVTEHDRYAYRGSDLASRFDNLVGRELFWKVTRLLATTACSALSEHEDLHQEFLVNVDIWLRQVRKLPSNEKIAAIELIGDALETEEPVRELLEALALIS